MSLQLLLSYKLKHNTIVFASTPLTQATYRSSFTAEAFNVDPSANLMIVNNGIPGEVLVVFPTDSHLPTLQANEKK